jgi:hypothetical protein
MTEQTNRREWLEKVLRQHEQQGRPCECKRCKAWRTERAKPIPPPGELTKPLS